MLKRISIDDLQPGMVIVQIAAQNGPVKIQKSGLVTSPEMILGLAEMGVQELEIDPEQTVELIAKSSKEVTKSRTQVLLESTTQINKEADNSISEQFNRSLFLPSARALPSLWQIYTKQVIRYALVALGGLSIGWLLATYDTWLISIEPQVVKQHPAAVLPAAPLTAPATSANEPQVAESPVNDVAIVKQATDGAQTSPAANSEPQQILVSADTPTTPDITQATLEQAVALVSQQLANQESPDSEQPKVLGYDPSQDNQQTLADGQESDRAEGYISPELLRKFERAVAEVAEKPDSEYEVTTLSPDDVLRIDQIPARYMTRLPTMAFSAHMYASNPAERWVRVNDRRKIEGDWIDNSVQIVRIEPQHVILRIEQQEFSMNALTDW